MPGDSPGHYSCCNVYVTSTMLKNMKTQQQHNVQASGSLPSHEFKKVTKLHAKR